MGGDMQERISVRAYRIWEEKGRPHGSAEDHWHQAKREIEEEEKAAPDRTAARPGRPPGRRRPRRPDASREAEGRAHPQARRRGQHYGSQQGRSRGPSGGAARKRRHKPAITKKKS